ncbi:hypothetical protein SCHPADRAFT_917901 [Schizopora paradoxa]|uniref:CxC2-like cysteine cluster KDZ transposase-associated domain-containing protein n=1 Tax=Schizopora paradoxa TaxID=27342 RepID=A0A0H2R075_9AGAM|nr:hypothetical protein SCHPADRAFT_917901 [Schizopora paradoxa]
MARTGTRTRMARTGTRTRMARTRTRGMTIWAGTIGLGTTTTFAPSGRLLLGQLAQSVPLSPPKKSPLSDCVRNIICIFQVHINIEGDLLPEDADPEPAPNMPEGAEWLPFESRIQFETTELLYLRNEMPQNQINKLMELWHATLLQAGSDAGPPFGNCREMHTSIDDITYGDAPWSSFRVKYSGDIPNNAPKWMTDSYEVCVRDVNVVVANLLKNTDFAGDFDYAAYQEYNSEGTRRYCNYMSGDLAWKHSDQIAELDGTEGAMYVPIILGSDKTTVSVATGQHDYHPVYLSIGNVSNAARRAHRNAVIVVAFLAIPKTEKHADDSEKFRLFRRQLQHLSFTKVLEPLKKGMTVPEIRQCPDKHFRRCIYGIGALIVDYPDQVYHTCIVQGWCPKCTAKAKDLDNDPDSLPRTLTFAESLIDALDAQDLWDEFGMVEGIVPFTNDFPRADVYELISPDLLHQVIKGTFKDHLVKWIGKYLKEKQGKARSLRTLAAIDRRLAAVPPFSCLRRFAEGRGFKQWTGDDSKALMKVYLPALRGLVPDDIVRTIRSFLDFCYLARRSFIDENDLEKIEDVLEEFYRYREVFRIRGVRPKGFSLPRQHTIKHYPRHIRLFAAPNGLCTSITESKHIKAVKKPWRRSNKFNALKQMLLTNQRLDKLIAFQCNLKDRGLLESSRRQQRRERGLEEQAANNIGEAEREGIEGVVEGPRLIDEVKLAVKPQRKYPRSLHDLASHQNIQVPQLPLLVGKFLFRQIYPDAEDDDTIIQRLCVDSKVFVFHSAKAYFYAPSDLSGVGGMRKEIIRATPSWRNGLPRYDCVFVVKGEGEPGFRDLNVARVKLFLSFVHREIRYDCTLVHWYNVVGQEPDNVTDMRRGRTPSPHLSIIHVDTIFRAAHLIPVYPNELIDKYHKHETTLDTFDKFFVNKFADHHAHEIAF